MTNRPLIRTAVLGAIVAAALIVATGLPVPAQAQGSAATSTVEGIVIKRAPDSITVRDAHGTDIVVVLTSTTKVKERKSNPFRGSKDYTITQLVRGLTVEVKGPSQGANRIEAKEIRIRDNDVRVATSVLSTVEPVENRLSEVENRLKESEQNAQRLSGQVAEVSSLASAAGTAAKNAQASGDAARDAGLKAAEAARAEARAANERTNNRINALDDYEAKSTATVLFPLGVGHLSKAGMATLDGVATLIASEKGYMIEITGYASSDGDMVSNQKLSQKRAESVVTYLTEKHSIPLRRIVIPKGFGEKNPAVPNTTEDGRKQNRRVEIRVLVSKGLVESN